MQNNIRICFFFLYRQHSSIYGRAFFAKKGKQLKVVNFFCKKAPQQIFDWVLNNALGNTVTKSSHLKDISSVLKSSPDDGRGISQNIAYLNILFHDVINLLYMNTEQTSKNIFTYIFIFITFLDSIKLKILQIKITFFKQGISIIL